MKVPKQGTHGIEFSRLPVRGFPTELHSMKHDERVPGVDSPLVSPLPAGWGVQDLLVASDKLGGDLGEGSFFCPAHSVIRNSDPHIREVTPPLLEFLLAGSDLPGSGMCGVRVLRVSTPMELIDFITNAKDIFLWDAETSLDFQTE